MHPEHHQNLSAKPAQAATEPGPQSTPIPPFQHIASVTRFDDRSSRVTPFTDFLDCPCGTILLNEKTFSHVANYRNHPWSFPERGRSIPPLKIIRPRRRPPGHGATQTLTP